MVGAAAYFVLMVMVVFGGLYSTVSAVRAGVRKVKK